jgi:CheY-like chemotaxis protein
LSLAHFLRIAILPRRGWFPQLEISAGHLLDAMKVSKSGASDVPSHSAKRQDATFLRRRVLLAVSGESRSSVFLPVVRRLDAAIVQVSDGVRLRQVLLEQGPFDLLLSDARLAGENGVSMLASLRRDGLDLPFVIVQSVHQNLVRIATGGGKGRVLSTRVVGEVALVELVENLLDSLEAPASCRIDKRL